MKIAVIIAAAALLLLCAGLYCPLVTRLYTVKSAKLKKPIKIALLSDLHSSRFGKEQSELTALVEEFSPDIIAYTGDIYDDRRDFAPCGELFAALSKYPSFYVSGNHEMSAANADKIFERIESYGIKALRNEKVRFCVNGQNINIAGLFDPFALPDYTEFLRDIRRLGGKDGDFTLLLSHRPEFAAEYAKHGFDLSLCGHAHGGQWRLPYLINGLYAPHQGLFPRYAGGPYKIGEAVMIVSRGLSRLNPLPRIFNPHEAVFISVEPE